MISTKLSSISLITVFRWCVSKAETLSCSAWRREAQALAEAGVRFEIIPVSFRLAVPAYAGIPVTHRNLASSFTVVTAHEDPTSRKHSGLRASRQGHGNARFLMGARSIGRISAALMENGMSKDTPAAIIENGTTNRQAAYRCRLGEASSLAQREEISPPAVFLVGPVAGLEDLVWFEADESQEISWRCPPEEFLSKAIS